MSKLNLATLLGIPDLPKQLEHINTTLEATLADADPLIREAALRHLLAPSKRLRPALTLCIVKGLGKSFNKKAMAACAAIELAHVSSLIHDDIIDHADSRRGIPTINSQEGIDQAIIVGDYVLATACGQAALVSAEASGVVARAIARICDGQSREVSDQYNVEREGEAMLSSIRGKTAELFAAACRLGGLCANLKNAAELDALSTFGEQFGMAFQLIDDVLDFVSNAKLLGKPTGNDIVEGIYTMPLLLALHGPRQEEIQQALLERSRPTAGFTKLLIDEYAIGKTIEVAAQYNQRAVAALQPLGQQVCKALQDFPNAYLSWSLDNLVAPEYQQQLKLRVGHA